LYGHEYCSPTLRKEHKLKVNEKKVLWKILRSKTDEVTRGSRKLHDKEFYNLYWSTNIIREIKLKRMRLWRMQKV
jgi:hypothetical protein